MGPGSGSFAAVHPVSTSGWAAEGDGGLDRMVHGRERELRVISAFATGVDPTTLVVSGLSGSGKSVTVLAALRRFEAEGCVVRVVRSGSARPYAQGPAGLRHLDLSAWTAPAEPDGTHHVDPEGLMSAVAAFGHLGPGPCLLFVDDVDTLTPARATWLLELADLAYERGWRVVAAARHVEAPVPDDVDLLELGPLDEPALGRVVGTAAGSLVAADVVARLHRWSAGNVRVALELADGLTVAQLRGSAEWSGPDVVGPVARRTYRGLLDRMTPEETARLAACAPVRSGVRRGTGRTEHPLLALLCRERVGSPADVEAAHAVESVLEGLHLDDLPGLPEDEHDQRAIARAIGVVLLTGTTWTGAADPWRYAERVADWSDHLWWTDGAPDDARAAGARVAAELVTLERVGRLPDAARLRADLDVLAATSGRHWVSLCIQVRAHLLLGDVAAARRLLDGSRVVEGRTVAEIVARDVAQARLALVEGRAVDVRDHLDHASRLRPAVEDWLPVRGLRAVVDALLDGRVPDDVPAWAGSASTRALGEYAADLGLAHLAVGQAERAAELLTIGLERCSWSYRGRVHARADLVEAVVAAGGTRDGVPERVRRLLDPPLVPAERGSVDAAAAYVRTRALLTGRAALAHGVDGWLPTVPSPVSLWQRLRSLTAFGRACAVHGERLAAEPVLREAGTLAGLAGAPGWRARVEGGGEDLPEPLPWDRLDDSEREIVRLALGGATNAQIASAAYLSVRSVANRLRSIYAHLGLRDRRELVERAQTDPPRWLDDSP
ncbi:MAG TPA: LuxR family transcriptional regulator [Promicromonospora sp.]|nr:LuxR family transcriptional regulator [Promicromonospora sp.]